MRAPILPPVYRGRSVPLCMALCAHASCGCGRVCLNMQWIPHNPGVHDDFNETFLYFLIFFDLRVIAVPPGLHTALSASHGGHRHGRSTLHTPASGTCPWSEASTHGALTGTTPYESTIASISWRKGLSSSKNVAGAVLLVITFRQ